MGAVRGGATGVGARGRLGPETKCDRAKYCQAKWLLTVDMMVMYRVSLQADEEWGAALRLAVRCGSVGLRHLTCME